MDVTQSDVHEGLQFPCDVWDGLEEFIGLAHRHLKDVVDVLALVAYGEGVFLVAPSPAFVADHVHRRQEIHFNNLESGAVAGLAASACHIEGEPAGLEAADLCVGCVLEKVADVVEDSCECRRIGPWGASDGTLVDFDQLVYVARTFDRVVGKGFQLRPVELVLQDRHQGLVDQG